MKIVRTIFSIYAALIFAIFMSLSCILYVFIFMLTNEKRAPFIAHKYVSRPWAKGIFLFYGIRLKIYNRKVLDPKQTYVFIGNHRSLLDIPSYAIATNHVIRFLAKKELTKIPLLGYVINKLYISVDRSDKTARARSMDNMMKSLRDGISVFICPEGTRNKTQDPLLPFHDGAFRLAIETQLPLTMLVIENSDKLLSPVDAMSLKPGKIIGHWCEPIDTRGMKDVAQLKELAREKMMQKLSLRKS